MTADVKNEDVWDDTQAAESSHVLLETVVGLNTFLRAMNTVYFVYDEDFRIMHKSENFYVGEELVESADRLLYNTL